MDIINLVGRLKRHLCDCVPALLQAVTIVLSGLEDYEYNENVLSRLNDHLLGKALVGKVDNLAEITDLPTKGSALLPRMVLFDTSSEHGKKLRI